MTNYRVVPLQDLILQAQAVKHVADLFAVKNNTSDTEEALYRLSREIAFNAPDLEMRIERSGLGTFTVTPLVRLWVDHA